MISDYFIVTARKKQAKRSGKIKSLANYCLLRISIYFARHFLKPREWPFRWTEKKSDR